MRNVPAKLLYFLLKCYWFLFRPVTVGVKVLLKTQDDKVLLVRHTYQPGLHLPGGKLDRKETLVQAACRELREEVGVSLPEESLKLFSIYANFAEYKYDHVILFVADIDQALPLVCKKYEIAQAGFFHLGSIPGETSLASKRRLEEIVEGKKADYYW